MVDGQKSNLPATKRYYHFDHHLGRFTQRRYEMMAQATTGSPLPFATLLLVSE